MGYSHRYTWAPKAPRARAYAKAAADCVRILQRWKAENTTPGEGARIGYQVKDGWCGVYGKCESFAFPMNLEQMAGARLPSDTVKTNRYGYDTVIVACLAVLAQTGCVEVGSDGDPEEWTDGIRFASDVLGRTVSNPLEHPAPAAPAPRKVEPAPAAPTVPHYHVRKVGKQWAIERVDQVVTIGKVSSRSEALQVASLLAGRRGIVTDRKRD